METTLTTEQADKVMTQRGYKMLSHNQSGEVTTKINYVRNIPVGEKKVSLHATVNLLRATVEISFVELRRACQLLTGSLAYDHPHFEEFEQVLLIYAAQCTNQDPFLVLNGWLATLPEKPVDDLWSDVADVEKEFAAIVQEVIAAPPAVPEPEEPKPTKKGIKDRKRAFWDSITPIAKQREWDKAKTLKFYEYWTEDNKSATKFRRESENFFDINKRMATFDRIDNEKVGNRKSFADQKAEKQTAELKKVAKVIQTKNVF